MRLFPLLLLLALSAIDASAASTSRRYLRFHQPSRTYAFTFDTVGSAIAVEARAAYNFGRGRSGVAHEWWAICWNYTDSLNYDYLRINMRHTDYGMITDSRVARLSLGHRRGGKDTDLQYEDVEKGIDNGGGANSVALEWYDGHLHVLVGAKSLAEAMVAEMVPPVSAAGAVISSSPLDLQSLVIESVPDLAAVLDPGITVDSIMSRLAVSVDPFEGVWHYLDRSTDDRCARLGGKYSLYIVRDTDNGYMILYGGGGETNAKKWRPGMLKGRLIPTPFEAHYDVVWYDSMMERVDDECHASVDDESILSIFFPVHRSSLRFYRK